MTNHRVMQPPGTVSSNDRLVSFVAFLCWPTGACMFPSEVCDKTFHCDFYKTLDVFPCFKFQFLAREWVFPSDGH